MANIPIAILIFDNGGQITYRAYSPRQYNLNNQNNDQFGQFLADVYNKVSYNQHNPLNNATNYGRLKEVHTRHIPTPIQNRGNTCYFSTYIHPNINYKPINKNSPIFFDVLEAQHYANNEPNLYHFECYHERM